ncbi:hypothetical protein FA95DRAFT_1610715 [Auriscalpium vulgare]|uniref:Uncharacterized protein n=1 Tax=Auriscalpium vulgare TaxID=40419 RepID=A0ACB8RD46_9AGAM|nr:hypothetical protein FA95DRAFT_1610715 [Auriscalpium vulgare]
MDIDIDDWTDDDAVAISDALLRYVAHQARPESPHARHARSQLRDRVRNLATHLGDSSPVRGGNAPNEDAPNAPNGDAPGTQDARNADAHTADARTADAGADDAPAGDPKIEARHWLLLGAACARLPPVTVGALSQLIIDGARDGRYAIIENEAFIRALSGYAAPADRNWPAFPAAAAGAAPVSALCMQASDLRRSALTVDTVLAREKLLASDPTGHRWTRAVFDKIEAILLRCEVRSKRSGPGGAKWHTRLSNQRLEAWLSTHIGWESLYADNIDRAPKDYDADFVHAKKTFTRLMIEEQRNRTALHAMYMQFGPAILIDPLWTAANCYSHRSRGFAALLAALHDRPLTDADGLNPFRRAYAPTCIALCSLAEHLGGVDFLNHVVDFLAAVPSHYALWRGLLALRYRGDPEALDALARAPSAPHVFHAPTGDRLARIRRVDPRRPA